MQRHAWPAAVLDTVVPEPFRSHDLVLQEHTLEISNDQVIRGQRGEMYGRMLLRNRFHVNTERGAELLRARQLWVPYFSSATVLDARVIEPGGRIRPVTASEMRFSRSLDAEGYCGPGVVSFTDVDVPPGGELEVVLEHTTLGSYMTNELMVRGDLPIVRARVVLATDPERPPIIETFNGFPEPEVDPVGRANTMRWDFRMLDPLPEGAFALLKNCAPFFTLRYSTPASSAPSANAFDHRYPRDTYTGRRNVHAFTNYVNKLRLRYHMHDVMGPINEVIRFVHDSLQLVPDTAIHAETPIGQCFAQRRISRRKLFSLYRAMFNILEVPMIICNARSRYDGLYSLPVQNRATHEFLAFTEERRQTMHFIYPNTLYQRFFLDELPVDLNGAPVEGITYKEHALNTDQFSFSLPAGSSSTNFKQERVMVELTDDGSISQVTLRGSLGGFLPSALGADTANGPAAWRSRRLNAWIQRHFSLRAMDDLHLVSDTVGPRQWTYESKGYRYAPRELVPDGAQGFLFLPEPFVRWRPILDGEGGAGTCPDLLPFTYHLRTDLILHAPKDISVEMLQGITREVSNLFGHFSVSIDRPDQRTAVLHFDLAIFNDLIDPSMRPMVQEIEAAMQNGLRTPILVRFDRDR